MKGEEHKHLSIYHSHTSYSERILIAHLHLSEKKDKSKKLFVGDKFLWCTPPAEKHLSHPASSTGPLQGRSAHLST